MTSAQAIERALREITPAPTPEAMVPLRTMLDVRIKGSLRALAERVVNTNLLRKTFTETATAGEASLTTSLTASEPLILEGIRSASIFITGVDYAAQYKADRASLAFPASTEFAYWTLENQTIVIRDADGLGTYDGAVTIRNAPFIPTLANVPVSLEHLFVLILADVKEKAA